MDETKKEQEGEVAGDVVNQLTDMDIPRVDLVGLPANRRVWALRKSEDAVADSADVEEVVEDKGEKDMAEEEKKEVVAEVASVPIEPTVPVVKAEEVALIKSENVILKDRIVALEKAVRVKELEPLCKPLNLDVEIVYKSEQVNAEGTKYFLGKLDEANKRIGALMKEAGTDVDKPAPSGFIEAVNKVMTDRKLDWNAASDAISKEQPELVSEYIATRQRETRTV